MAAVWTAYHGDYSSWYCLPFTSIASWLSISGQSIITFVSVSSLAVCVGCYYRMIAYLYKEEHVVQAMRSRKVSNTRMIAKRFTLTFLLHMCEGVLIQSVVWLPLFGYEEWISALTNVLYVLTVTLIDVYLYGYVALKKTILNWLPQKPK